MSSPTRTATTASEGRASAGPHARVVLTVASLGFFLITLDISIVNVALSRVRDELGPAQPFLEERIVRCSTLSSAARG